MTVIRSTICAIIAISAFGCATTSTTSTHWTAPDQSGAPSGARAGTVDSVGEVVHSVEGNPAGGAAAGALVGGLVFRSGLGAVAGAGAGAAMSSGSSETREYEVIVRFDDGERGAFTYRDRAPFRPGDRVQMGPNGPVPMAG